MVVLHRQNFLVKSKFDYCFSLSYLFFTFVSSISTIQKRNVSSNANIGDINGDGKLDIVISNSEFPHMVYSYKGNYEFDSVEIPRSGTQTSPSILADIDGNGLLDYIIGILTEDDNEVLMNYVDDRYGVIELPGVVQATTTIVAGIIDDNDHIDLVFGNRLQQNQLMLNNVGGSNFEMIELPGGVYDTTCIVIMLYDSDSLYDLFVVEQPYL